MKFLGCGQFREEIFTRVSLSHYRRYVPQLQVFLSRGTASQVTPFHPSCSYYRPCNSQCFRCLARCPCPSTTVRDSYATMCHSGEMSRYLSLPYVDVLHRKTTVSQPYIHRGPHLQLPSQEIHLPMLEFVCACSRYQIQR